MFTTHRMKVSHKTRERWLCGRTDEDTYHAVKSLCLEQRITIQDLLNRLVRNELAKTLKQAKAR